MKKTKRQDQTHKGFVLITSVIIMSLLVLLVVYVINFTITELKISSSQAVATKTYYLAEAGINEMLWKIKNDPAIRNAFLWGTLNPSYDINRTNVLGDSHASYQVAARNTVTAEAWIIATSTYQIAGRLSQRVVKSYISQATGNDPDWNFSVFAGGRGSQQNGNLTIAGSSLGIILTANGGRLHANQVFKVQGAEVVINNGAATASNVINIVAGGILTLNNSYQEAPTTTVDMLQIDFDSADPNSWKNRATATYTASNFNNLPDNTILNGIIYVTGEAEITNKNFTINGVLVAQDDIEITNSGKNVTVNVDPVYGGGLLAKEDVEIETNGGAITINGLVYASDDLEITANATNFTINGSLTGFDAEITSNGGSIILNYEPDNFQSVVNPIFNPDAPLIQIDHWEEEY